MTTGNERWRGRGASVPIPKLPGGGNQLDTRRDSFLSSRGPCRNAGDYFRASLVRGWEPAATSKVTSARGVAPRPSQLRDGSGSISLTCEPEKHDAVFDENGATGPSMNWPEDSEAGFQVLSIHLITLIPTHDGVPPQFPRHPRKFPRHPRSADGMFLDSDRADGQRTLCNTPKFPYPTDVPRRYICPAAQCLPYC